MLAIVRGGLLKGLASDVFIVLSGDTTISNVVWTCEITSKAIAGQIQVICRMEIQNGK